MYVQLCAYVVCFSQNPAIFIWQCDNHGISVSAWPRHPADPGHRGRHRGRHDAMAAPHSFSGVMTPHDRCQMGQAGQAKFVVFTYETYWNIANDHRNHTFWVSLVNLRYHSITNNVCERTYWLSCYRNKRNKACRACKWLSKIRHEKGPKQPLEISPWIAATRSKASFGWEPHV